MIGSKTHNPAVFSLDKAALVDSNEGNSSELAQRSLTNTVDYMMINASQGRSSDDSNVHWLIFFMTASRFHLASFIRLT